MRTLSRGTAPNVGTLRLRRTVLIASHHHGNPAERGFDPRAFRPRGSTRQPYATQIFEAAAKSIYHDIDQNRSTSQERKLAERGFDPRTFGL